MFTGLVEEAGVIEAVTPSGNGVELAVRTRVCGGDLKPGDSVAVNGCCLTVTRLTGRGKERRVYFDLLRETLERTNLGAARPGSLANLERALRADARLGGHFVTGHIDGTGVITRWEQAGADHVLEIKAPRAVMRYVIFKGSIAVDGISLTVAAVKRDSFRVWIIPHTREVTALRERVIGGAVNLEADLLGKYVERLLGKRATSRAEKQA
jgi:riboflavin synthase